MRFRRIMAGVAVTAASVLAVGSGAASSSAAPARAAAATSRCVGLDGSAVAGPGPARATVVVDTGSGPVWSACISFSGSISGIDALDRADSVIADLDPVYDQYVGLGRAVCRLRGIGSDPPDCLGKSASYWSFSVNGRVASVGAGAVTVRDGDVHGWQYGSGGTPRTATEGSRAASASVPPTTVAPSPTPTAPPATPSPTPPRGPAASATVPAGGAAVSTSVGTAPTDATTTVAPSGADRKGEPGGERDPSDEPAGADAAVEGSQELASGALTSAGSPPASSSDEGLGAGPLVRFAAALAALAAIGLWVRARRRAAAG